MSFTQRFEEFVFGVVAADWRYGGDDIRDDINKLGIRQVVRERMWIGRDDWCDVAMWYLHRRKTARQEVVWR